MISYSKCLVAALARERQSYASAATFYPAEDCKDCGFNPSEELRNDRRGLAVLGPRRGDYFPF